MSRDYTNYTSDTDPDIRSLLWWSAGELEELKKQAREFLRKDTGEEIEARLARARRGGIVDPLANAIAWLNQEEGE